jgi:hypothetical protein
MFLQLDENIYLRRGPTNNHIRCGLTARISRFHRGGRGSIPRTGTSSFVFWLPVKHITLLCIMNQDVILLFLSACKGMCCV